MEGITYCYSGTVEPESFMDGDSDTITVNGTPIEFDAIESCDTVTEDGGNKDSSSSSLRTVSSSTSFWLSVMVTLVGNVAEIALR